MQGFVTNADETRRPPNEPLMWFGHDRVVMDSISRLGLHRWVIARKGEPPKTDEYLASAARRAGDGEVLFWEFEQDGYFYLYMVWKLPP